VLGKIVSRLAGQPSRTGRDWAELARETVTWGEKLQSEKQPVTEGPVRDALLAVDLGSTLDAKTADWPTLRRELEALLQKPESQEQPDQPQDQSEKQDQDQQSQQNQDSSPSEQNQQQQQDQSSPSEQSPSESQQKNDPAPGDPKQDSAFGDMQQKAEPPPPPPSSETQKVGGAPEKKDPDQAATDPALTMPLQKLEQLRNQDSPARLFQMMEGEKKPAPAKKGKDW
jgi:Ca-activated chloride channel family protein